MAPDLAMGLADDVIPLDRETDGPSLKSIPLDGPSW